MLSVNAFKASLWHMRCTRDAHLPAQVVHVNILEGVCAQFSVQSQWRKVERG